MNIYKFGAVLNIVVILLIGVAFTLVHLVDGFYVLVMENIFDPFNVSKSSIDEWLFSHHDSTINIFKPIAISIALVSMFFLVGVCPLKKINRLVKSNSTIHLGYFIIAMFFSLGLGGGLFMLIGLGSLKAGIAAKQETLLANQYMNVNRTAFIRKPFETTYTQIKNNYVNENTYFKNKCSHKSIPLNSLKLELKKRIWNLEKNNGRIKENIYLNKRRQNQRIENLEMDLASMRRCNRFY